MKAEEGECFSLKEKNLSYITETTRIRNTNLKWADFVNKDG